jgi:hypothetical protein
LRQPITGAHPIEKGIAMTQSLDSLIPPVPHFPIRETSDPWPEAPALVAPDPAAGPPLEVLSALDTAGAVLRDLAEQDLTIHVGLVDAVVRLEVRSAGGDVVREVRPSYVLDVLAGEGRETRGGSRAPLL